MRRENLPLIGILILALIGGLWIGQRLLAESETLSPPEANAFRLWFWEHRSMDLLVQVGLIFGGTLGIAALLPGDGEEREP